MREGISRIKLVLFDVDGVLTDGRIYIDNNGVESKAFDVKDGHGLKLLQRAGFRVGLITGRQSRVVEHRAEELGIGLIFQGVTEKLPVFERIARELHLEDEEIAYMGDDLVDLPVLRRAGISATVADACEEVKPEVDFVASRAGGRGAVREFCELLLKESGRWSEVFSRYS
ncbi:MAG: HAD-IIIA family hydrolase [Desulfuromonadaceae bacterium]|nr:HAD-IIIA family hydrolase [Desulfuromonadaceae bacterium]